MHVPEFGTPKLPCQTWSSLLFIFSKGIARGEHQLPLVWSSCILISRVELQSASTRHESVPPETVDTSPGQWYSGVGYAGQPHSKGPVISGLMI